MTSTRTKIATETMSGARKKSKSHSSSNAMAQKFRLSTALTTFPLAALLALGFGGAANGTIFSWGAPQTIMAFSDGYMSDAIIMTPDAGTRLFDTQNHSVTLLGSLAGAHTFTKTGNGTLVFSRDFVTTAFSGGMTLHRGSLSLESNLSSSFGTITTTGSVIDYADGVNNGAAININSDTTQLQVATGTATQSGVISETAGPRRFDKIGDGRLVLTAANSFTGNTWIRAGVLNVRNGAALGGTTATLVRNGAALELEGGIDIGNEELALIGTGVSNGGALRNVSGNNRSSGHIQLETTARINSDSGTLTIDGALRGASGNDTLFIGGPGTVTFSGDGPTKGAVIGANFVHDGGTLNIEEGVSFTALRVQNQTATINNSGTLSASLVGPGNKITNFGTLNNLATGILNGDVSNLGTANLRGTVNGNVRNGVDSPFTGIISLQDGAINTLTINGNLQSGESSGLGWAPSTLKFDTKMDRPAGQADMITVNGNFTGIFDANFSNIGEGTLDTPGTTTFITVTGSSDATLGTTTGLLQTSVMENQVVKSGKNWVIQTTIKLNPINKLVGSVVTAQNLVPTSIPDLPLQNSNLKEGCLVTGTGSPFAGRATGASTTTGGNSPNASSSVDVSYGGLQFNIDYGCFDIDGKGSSIRVGALAGFSFGNTGQNDTTQNVMTNSDFETRFGGVYTKFDAANGFFASLSGIHSETSFDIASTISGIDFVHARDFKTSRNAINGEIGMAFKPTADVSITPVLGINYSVSDLSDMTITGPGGGKLVFDDIVGIVGYTGVTFSKAYSLDDGKSAFSPFFGIKIYNDFGGSVVATYVSPSGNKTPTFTDTAGTYGELTAGLNYSSFNPSWAGVNQLDASIRADLTFGRQITSGRVTANLQIRF